MGLFPAQQTYGKKNLLYCEMELLNTIKRYQKYKKLRKEELALKRLLKKALGELQEEVRGLNQILPHVKDEKFEPVSINRSQKKRNTLESEIEEIKRKIAMLS